HYNLGNALMALGQADEAVAAYATELRQRPDHQRAAGNLAVAYANIGAAFLDQGDLGHPIEALDAALRLKPDVAEAHYNRGNVLRFQGELDDAAAAYIQALALNPAWPEALSNLGNTLAALGKFDEAGAVHRQAAAIAPAVAEIHYN